MEQVDGFVKTAVGEIERLISARTVVGEPITIEGATIIPLLGIGFWFGAGAVSAKGEVKQKGEGSGGAGGGGTSGIAGVKPVAVIIIDKGGVRIEPIKGGLAIALEKIAETIPQVMRRPGKEKKEG